MEVNSDQTQKAYRRNFLLMIIASIGIAASLISSQFCAPGEEELSDSTSDPLAMMIEQRLTLNHEEFYFDVKLLTHEILQDSYRIDVISKNQDNNIKQYLAAFIRSIETASLSNDINVQFVLIAMDPETGAKKELERIETSVAPDSSVNVEESAEPLNGN